MTTTTPETTRSYDRFYIGGEWVEPEGGGRIEVVSPASEELLGHVPEPTTADIDRAVAAARAAFDGPWRQTTPAQRGAALNRLADAIESRISEFAELFALEVGAPLAVGTNFHALAVTMLRQFAELHRTTAFEEDRMEGADRIRIVREPVGVVGAIIPWNGPVAAAAFKLGPALAAGCTVVLKPAPEGPLTAYLLAECVQRAAIPDGVVNIVAGGRDVGEHLVTHPDVDKIAFTGSTAAGKRIASLCGQRIARATLELGGKSAAIVAADVDPADVIPTVVPAGIGHTGQVCAAITRVIVPQARHDEYAAALAEALAGITVGDPFDPSTALGPLAMERQRDRVESYVAAGLAEGAELVTGGRRPERLDRGWYFEPTLFGNVRNDMTIAREEIFGPVISLIPYDGGIENAIAIANDSPYGLAGAVYTADRQVAERVAREVRTGQMYVNNAGMCVTQPFGGFKESGIGREGGPEGLAGYLETKMINFGEETVA